MITPIKSLTVNEVWEREEDLLVSNDDIKELTRDERTKAIDDFAEQLRIDCRANTCKVTINGMKNVDILTLDSAMDVITDVAKRMKGEE